VTDLQNASMRPKEMIHSEQPPLISGTQFLAIVVMTMAIFLVVDFGRRATTGYQVAQNEKRLQAEIQAELTRRAQLEARRDEVLSDAFVERWAREEAHMARPGDRRLVVLTPAARGAPRPGELSPPGLQEASPAVPNWYHWWRLFFDQEPGVLREE
jgi:hypothetical protein